MRSTWVLAAAAVVYGAAASAGDSAQATRAPAADPQAAAAPIVETVVVPQDGPKVVHLYTSAQLEQLRKDNPKHYAQAERIMAARSKLCAPGPASLLQVAPDVHDLQCNSMSLRTSLPPKVDMRFRIDDTVYIARVVVMDAVANAVKVKSP